VRKAKFAAILFCAVLLQLGPSVSDAETFGSTSGGDPNGDGSGCCFVPKELEENSIALQKQFAQMDRKTLLTEQFAQTLCSKHDCGEINEEQASQLLDGYFQEQDRSDVEDEKQNAWWLNLLSIAIAAAGVVIGGLAYRHGVEAERRSIRNEVEIEHLKEKPAKRIAG
jgi:hypothetical protein